MNLAIFASGNGSNAQHIISTLREDSRFRFPRIFCNNPRAFVIERAAQMNIPVMLFNRQNFYDQRIILDQLIADGTHWIILAGFLWLIPQNILSRYHRRIINIHPALLPKYGGRGMYGMNIHRSVISAGDDTSGITIHYVNEMYDAGEIIFQTRCPVLRTDTAEDLARKVHQLEYEHFPRVIRELLSGQSSG